MARAHARASVVSADADVLEGEDEALFNRLRALRKQIADDAGMPPYIVFSDKTLKGMVRLRPQTEEELLQVSGVGQKKLASYGEAFLKELQR